MLESSLSPEAQARLMAIARQIRDEVSDLPDSPDKQAKIQARIRELYQAQFPEDYERIKHLLQGS
ncbi:hypothetical protein COW36_17870 [bacterium (Candidatus Blackallbacteria) CG17_big_fil_post_rev_8_21_14_2_50_48_46]|uniref:Uncharacterized protein n=1 Tax=bacterium (Candidatus Blackallbacteria) CG17_big_fil_post_rev_8_21_14_2_50_48_46 TaxID=2014261 RepID=A0A2M7G0P6_9BACT|nr:MAG: hypothetical protein COW64_00855 [bacterium (Candidatus Blackallbacteria) CG18_big_fil_WC_8_21_14_2_50_49_26]PIW15284.1 MAG: hypothetical protein COW36_17870 [bacterium (Candidatus Blackallbacteria) CG17_big_fil_post_rev_8_21_14_2_50_48_46]PIW45207.1 MAG: hypothetical protein COW20_21145 [bacterium (Candidatus Blackallbacteria) CG13_big_fil_rev_8_21_14_2_50_49_14]